MNAITDRSQIEQAYAEFAHVVSEGSAAIQCKVGHPGGSGSANVLWHKDLQLWVLLEPRRHNNRYWCAFGVDEPRPAQMLGVTCEINSPKEGVNRHCAGLFVRDQRGNLVLAHSGKIGGGRGGIGKDAFLTYLGKRDVVSVNFPGGEEFEYIAIGCVTSHDFRERLADFVHTISRCKDEATGEPGPWRVDPTERDGSLNHLTFQCGRVYNRRADIHRHYGGQQQGGISTPKDHSCLFLFTGPSGEQHGYRDGWNEDGVFLYTGEGQSGDMEFVRGNLAIRDHVVNGRDLHVFESLGREGCRYLRRFDCVGWEYRQGPDTAGRDRRIIVFHLMPEEEVGSTVSQEQVVCESSTLEELRLRALEAVPPPAELPARETRRLYYQRSATVRAYVLARANGICEACRKPAPFNRRDGSPYLEPHHTRRVADGGPDHPRWVGGVCPNCHQEVHHGEHGQEVNRRLEEYLGSVESHEES